MFVKVKPDARTSLLSFDDGNANASGAFFCVSIQQLLLPFSRLGIETRNKNVKI